MKTKKNLIYADECYRIMGIVFKVYKELGYGHKEKVFQKVLADYFKENKFEFKEQLKYKVVHKDRQIGIYILDFLLFNKIVLEIKQRNYISSKDIDQLYKYLKVTGLKLGLIVTFTNQGVKYKRIVNLD